MSKYAIAFVTPEDKPQLKHSIVEGDDQESALRSFFDKEVTAFYSNDDQGYYYFKEDFNDESAPSGHVLAIS